MQLLWLHLGVRQQVALQAAPLTESKFAERTLLAVVLCVQDLVHRKRSQLAETDSTLVTFQRLLLGVGVHVVSQVVLSAKTLSTLSAGERSLVCVSSLVDHHVVTFGELSMAELADEPLLWSRGSGLGLVRMVRVHWVTLTMARVEARVKLVVTKPLLEEQSLAEARGEGGQGEVEVVRGRGGGGPGGGGGGGREQRGHRGQLGAAVKVQGRVLISREHGGVN